MVDPDANTLFVVRRALEGKRELYRLCGLRFTESSEEFHLYQRPGPNKEDLGPAQGTPLDWTAAPAAEMPWFDRASNS